MWLIVADEAIFTFALCASPADGPGRAATALAPRWKTVSSVNPALGQPGVEATPYRIPMFLSAKLNWKVLPRLASPVVM